MVLLLVTRTGILVAKNYIEELMAYDKLNLFYLALTEKNAQVQNLKIIL